ncbi:N-acetyl-glucosamine-6-phosphate deacetylase [Agyrium rufum]|nr:N-acetyl-glucosamine-6-phosphate deacetylase [Agyrium rufum]
MGSWICVISLLALCQLACASVWPAPTSFTNGTQVLWLAPGFKITTSGASTKRGLPEANALDEAALPSQAQILSAAAERTQSEVFSSAFVPWKFYPKNAKFEPSASDKKTMVLQLTVAINPSKGQAAAASDESYTLKLTASGAATITANSTLGGLRGMQSFVQLFYKHSQSPDLYTPIAPVSISDYPAYSHRGLNLDISRNYIPTSLVMSVIDSMAFNKLSHLHLHAADAQSWPLQIPALPELANNGAYQADLSWSPSDLSTVQSYGMMRGIEVYIELDTPGHTSAIGLSYPELITAFNEQPWDNYSAEPPSGQLKLNNPAVTTFITKLFNDLLPRTAPYSKLFHTGGDELNANCYGLDPGIKSIDPTIIAPYLQAFLDHEQKLVLAKGLTPVIWESLVLPPWNLTADKSTIVQSWETQDSFETVVKMNRYPVLFGETDHWYLDCGFGQWLDPANPASPSDPIAPPYKDYCDPQKSWREVYSYNPVQNLTAAQKKLVIGGEVHLWGELMGPENAPGRIWPRSSAAAEIMWSGMKGTAGVTEAVTRRLAEMRERLVARGVEGVWLVQMTWCLQNPGDCSL